MNFLQSAEVRNLTSMLESQIQESDRYHNEEVSSLKEKLGEVENLLNQERARNTEKEEQLSLNVKQFNELLVKVNKTQTFG